MKKKNLIMGILILVVMGGIVFLSLNRKGNVLFVKTSISSTENHSEADIKECMNIVKKTFKDGFSGCRLTDLCYDDEFSTLAEYGWMAQYDGKEAIILKSNFRVGSSGGDGSLNPNETYTDWQWICVKDQDDHWQLETWGY